MIYLSVKFRSFLVKINLKLYQGYIVVGYRGTFAFGRDMSDVKVVKQSMMICTMFWFSIK